ncbi:MAG TPA: hypothetical protein VGC50_04270 [Gammaproteobacteria bacterium]|jgi:hypothetical protein
MTIFFTILAGVSTFILGQIVLKLIIDPVQEFKRTVADISHALIEHAQMFYNPAVVPDEDAHRVSDVFRVLSSRLNAQMYLIPKYDWTALVFGLPNRKDVSDAAGHLIGLSNSVFRSTAQTIGTKNPERSQKICNLLGIYVPERDRLTE